LLVEEVVEDNPQTILVVLVVMVQQKELLMQVVEMVDLLPVEMVIVEFKQQVAEAVADPIQDLVLVEQVVPVLL
jgi:hypothetical protein